MTMEPKIQKKLKEILVTEEISTIPQIIMEEFKENEKNVRHTPNTFVTPCYCMYHVEEDSGKESDLESEDEGVVKKDASICARENLFKY